ncbi:hypothetical protein V8G54_035457 [Vigna mungo]|uniref:Uncharacterized protein n=1 Tax=Vigna mungo TaxID=3915 RepID=A0AAQ3RAY5_VIGMU
MNPIGAAKATDDIIEGLNIRLTAHQKHVLQKPPRFTHSIVFTESMNQGLVNDRIWNTPVLRHVPEKRASRINFINHTQGFHDHTKGIHGGRNTSTQHVIENIRCYPGTIPINQNLQDNIIGLKSRVTGINTPHVQQKPSCLARQPCLPIMLHDQNKERFLKHNSFIFHLLQQVFNNFEVPNSPKLIN